MTQLWPLQTPHIALRSVEFHILLGVVDRPRHGYAILQEAEERTGGQPGIRDPDALSRAAPAPRRGTDRIAPPSPEPDTDERREDRQGDGNPDAERSRPNWHGSQAALHRRTSAYRSQAKNGGLKVIRPLVRVAGCGRHPSPAPCAVAEFPPSFRQDVGAAMVDDVRRRAARSREKTIPDSRKSFWLVVLTASLLVNAAAAWVERKSRHVRTIYGGPDRSLVPGSILKLAIRMLVKYPGLTVIGGLGIAVAVAIGVGFFALFHSRFYPDDPAARWRPARRPSKTGISGRTAKSVARCTTSASGEPTMRSVEDTRRRSAP